jgi:hypothetical protein
MAAGGDRRGVQQELHYIIPELQIFIPYMDAWKSASLLE